MSRKRARWILGLGAAVALLGAGAYLALRTDWSRPAAGGRAEAAELVFSALREPDTLIPFLAETEEAAYVSELVFDGLINRTVISRQGKALYSKALCKRYREESSENRREITLQLDLGATWHNGEAFSADDVLFTWEALHASRSPLVGWLDTLVESIYKIDDDEIHLTLRVERSEEALNEILSTFKILPRVVDRTRGEEGRLPADLSLDAGVVNDFRYRPVGTGPYRIVDRRGNQIHLERNENYFLGPPRVPRLRMSRMEAPELAVKALIEDSVQLVFDVQPRFFGQLGGAAVRSLDYTPYGFFAIVYNLRRPPFDELRFRRAVNLATEKGILFSIYTDLRDSDAFVNTSVYPHNYEFVRKDPEAFASNGGYAPDRARRALGGAGGGFALTLSSELQGANARKLGQAYAELMQQAGLVVTIDDRNMVGFDAARRERDFQAMLVEFSGFNHLYDLRGLFAEDNLFGLQDAPLQGLLEAYGRTLSWADLERISRQIHERVEELAPACFLFTPPRRAFMAQNLSNVSIHPEVGFATVETWEFE